MNEPLQTPEAPLTWMPGAAQMPVIPMLPPGEDPMSAMISAMLPTMATPLEAQMTELTGKEEMFAGKLGAATGAYQNADSSGGESVQQIVEMLGQVGEQAGQMMGAPAEMLGMGGGMGAFSALLQPLMQAAQAGGAGHSAGGQGPGGAAGGQPAGGQGAGTAGSGGGAGSGQSAGGQSGAGQGAGGAAGNAGQGSTNAGGQQRSTAGDAGAQQQSDMPQHIDRSPQGAAQAEEGAGAQHRPAPVTPPPSSQHQIDRDELARKM